MLSRNIEFCVINSILMGKHTGGHCINLIAILKEFKKPWVTLLVKVKVSYKFCHFSKSNISVQT